MKPLFLAAVILTTTLRIGECGPSFVLTANGKRALAYQGSDTAFKPYVAQLYSPGGVQVLRDAPSDHLHHHGLMFALGANGVDFWAETPKCGRQLIRDMTTGRSELLQTLDWVAPDQTVILSETRRIIVHEGADLPATLVTWQSRLVPQNEVKLTGSHYFGLGMRFVAEMDRIGTFLNAANATGEVVRGDERLVAATWCAYRAPNATVAVFDHPSNPRHPARMFTMAAPFAYLSATLNLWKDPFTLKEPLELRYGIAVWDGQPDAAQIEALYRRWLDQPIRVLILSGQNNHNWQKTTPKLRAILETDGRFMADVTEQPEQCDAATLARYDVVLSNWNTWGKPAGTNRPTVLLDFVRAGKGFVAVHAGSSSFYDCPEYQQLAGASWKLGQTNHGQQHTFTVKPVTTHPITDGLKPFTTTDELWRNPSLAPGATVLATADNELVALATHFGQGRGFTLLLGHDVSNMDNPGFQSLLIRGIEWAATGRVTQPAADPLLKAVAAYRYGNSRAALLEVSRAAQNAPTEWAPKLVELLAAETTSLDGKKFVCEQLGLIGTVAEAPALEKWLGHPDLGFFARAALERIRGETSKIAPPTRLAELIEQMSKNHDRLLESLDSADKLTREAALRAARDTKDPQLLRAIAQRPNLSPPLIQLLAGEPSALPAVTKAVASDDAAVRQAAIIALGAIGNASSVPVLVGLLERADKQERRLISDALARLRGDGVDVALAKAAQPETIRALVSRNAKSTVPALLALAKNGNREAIAALGRLADDPAPLIPLLDKEGVESAVVAICRRTGDIQPLIAAANGPQRAFVLPVLGALGGERALAALRAALKSDDAEAKLAAVRALLNWDTAAPLPDLQEVLATATDPKLKALAERAVSRLEMIGFDVKGRKNLALGATATNPDGLKPDGQGGPPSAAIDGDPKTYWDEVDGQPLYQLRVQLKQPATVCAIRISGWRHHNHAPKDFEVLCDDRVLKSVTNAQYQDNQLLVVLPPTRCATIQLNITGYYPKSPAIRELEIYGKD